MTQLLLVLLTAAGPTALPTACNGDVIAVLPMLPVATSSGVARAEEENLRVELSTTTGLCLQPREETLKKLGNLSPVACDDADCHRRIAEQLAVGWVIWGSVFGFGGKTTVAAQLWDATGERVSRRSWVPEPGLKPASALLTGARALPSGAVPGQSPVVGRAVPLALVGTAGVAFAAGLAFGFASMETSRTLETGTTGCHGTGDTFVSCLNDRATLGRRQALAANSLYGASVLLGLGAAFTFAWGPK